MKTYNKLVRDKIPLILEGKGLKYNARVASEKEYTSLLTSKLLEEINELVESKTHKNFIEELADIHEVLHAIEIDRGIDPTDVVQAMHEKRNKRGGFDEKIILIEAQ